MSTIEERIAKHEKACRILSEKIRNHEAMISRWSEKRGFHTVATTNLKAKLVKQQAKDKATGKALVESGAITEEQKEKAEKLPLPEGQTAQRLPREKVD